MEAQEPNGGMGRGNECDSAANWNSCDICGVFFQGASVKVGLNKKREEGSSVKWQSIGKLIIHDTARPYELNSYIEFEKAKFMAKVKKE